MWIAVAVLAATVVGVVAWWFRREPVGGGAYDTFEAERKWGWEFRLTPDAGTAFAEGLRAYHDAGNALDVAGEQGVLTTYDPPRLISLHLLADGFTALGDAAMHDPHGTVAALIARSGATEQPGVLHLRREWPDGDVAGMDRTSFAGAVREIVCPPGAEGLGAWPGEHGVGALQVRVLAGHPDPEEETPSHVNGRTAAAGLATATMEDHVAEGAPGPGGRYANTMLLDLGRVLDLYLEAREKRPDAAAGELLREVVPGVVAAGGPGLTWVRPPTPEERRIVAEAANSSELR
ncbi:hypothetical protein [Nonomuraea basaltis]|uniref:hypothetical protein n=1 Tax=Nonomuraea basaltis TaxID=2495887 RepID=UPI00110C6240|nr:hypothetical protein [Nonomuraea basaltis]TMR95878.1 hypothetical protein EJK15_26350 [Nonomuraea basaltis]